MTALAKACLFFALAGLCHTAAEYHRRNNSAGFSILFILGSWIDFMLGIYVGTR